MEYDMEENAQINQKIFLRIANRILSLEIENLKTSKFGSSEMTDKIYKLIIFEVDKNDD